MYTEKKLMKMLINEEIAEFNFEKRKCKTSLDFSDINLQNKNLQNADFSNTVLISADLSSADIRGANFRNANMFDADLRGSLINSKTVFLGANLSKAKLDNTNILDAIFDLEQMIDENWTLIEVIKAKLP